MHVLRLPEIKKAADEDVSKRHQSEQHDLVPEIVLCKGGTPESPSAEKENELAPIFCKPVTKKQRSSFLKNIATFTFKEAMSFGSFPTMPKPFLPSRTISRVGRGIPSRNVGRVR